MNKEIKFKDGHAENIILFYKWNEDEVKSYIFATKSGLYFLSVGPLEVNDDSFNRNTRGVRSFCKLDNTGKWTVVENIASLDFSDSESELNNEPTKPSRISVDDYYLNIAKAVCKRSTCMRRHYGAVIVKNGEIISTGYNGSPRGEDNCCDTGICGREGNAHNDGDYRKCPAVHAEMNALLSAARKDTIGSTLYLYGEDADGASIDASPCPICSALIRNAGVERIVGSHAGD